VARKGIRKTACLFFLSTDPQGVDQMKIVQELLTKGMHLGDKTIKDELGSEAYAILEEDIESTGLPMENFMKMKPALLSITLSALKVAELGYSPEPGIDLYFAKKASGKKPILELESAREQMDMLLNMPGADLYLKYTIMDNSRTDEQVEGIMEAWRSGDADKMNSLVIEEILREYPDLNTLLDEILFKRNGRMVQKIRGYLSTDKTYFVVVGAPTLSGTRGL
jgi:uncharacterized protein YbaP (TraB family)